MIFIGVGYATMLIDAAGTYERTDGHTRTTQRIDCAQQLIRVVDRRGCVVTIWYRSCEGGCIVIDCRSFLRAGAVLRINDNSVRQGMRGVVVKVLYDLATAVGRAEYVPVKIVGAAGSNPGVVQILQNTFCSQVAHDWHRGLRNSRSRLGCNASSWWCGARLHWQARRWAHHRCRASREPDQTSP